MELVNSLAVQKPEPLTGFLEKTFSMEKCQQRSAIKTHGAAEELK
jgi:hypothetical protein